MKCHICKGEAVYTTPSGKGLCKACYQKQYKNIREDKPHRK